MKIAKFCETWHKDEDGIDYLVVHTKVLEEPVWQWKIVAPVYLKADVEYPRRTALPIYNRYKERGYELMFVLESEW